MREYNLSSIELPQITDPINFKWVKIDPKGWTAVIEIFRTVKKLFYRI